MKKPKLLSIINCTKNGIRNEKDVTCPTSYPSIMPDTVLLHRKQNYYLSTPSIAPLVSLLALHRWPHTAHYALPLILLVHLKTEEALVDLKERRSFSGQSWKREDAVLATRLGREKKL